MDSSVTQSWKLNMGESGEQETSFDVKAQVMYSNKQALDERFNKSTLEMTHNLDKSEQGRNFQSASHHTKSGPSNEILKDIDESPYKSPGFKQMQAGNSDDEMLFNS